ncbi:hypothetical protein PJI17_29085 [Mycobacterium kansasii]
MSAHSAPSAHTRRRQRTLGAVSAHSAPSAHTLGRQRTSRRRERTSRRRERTLDAVSAHSMPSAADPTASTRFAPSRAGAQPMTALSENSLRALISRA